MVAAIELNKSYTVDDELPGLYTELFPKCASFIAKRSGSLEDARDLFHDALILYLEKKSSGVREIKNGQAYIMTIFKNLYFSKIKKDQLNENAQEINPESIIDNFYPDKLHLKLYNSLQMAGRKCMDLLSSFYFEQKSIREIKDQFNFSSDHSVSAQKYKCVEKLRIAIKQKSLNYEDFE